MAAVTRICGGTLVLPEGLQKADLWIRDDKIAQIGGELEDRVEVHALNTRCGIELRGRKKTTDIRHDPLSAGISIVRRICKHSAVCIQQCIIHAPRVYTDRTDGIAIQNSLCN